MEHGRDLDGLAPSTYEATLAFNLGDGYPGRGLRPARASARRCWARTSPGWCSPTWRSAAALLALALWELAGDAAGRCAAGRARGRRVRRRAAGAAVRLLPLGRDQGGRRGRAASRLPLRCWRRRSRAGRAVRGSLPRAASARGALVAVLSVGGVVWLAPVLASRRVVGAERGGWARAARRAAVRRRRGVGRVLSLPVLVAGALLPPTSSPLTRPGALGNLGGPARSRAGRGDLARRRLPVRPRRRAGAHLPARRVALAPARSAGLVIAWRRRAWAPLRSSAARCVAALAIALVGSPWVEGKALATASVVVPFAALVGACALWGTRRARRSGAALAVLVAGGVLWSNALGLSRASTWRRATGSPSSRRSAG